MAFRRVPPGHLPPHRRQRKQPHRQVQRNACSTRLSAPRTRRRLDRLAREDWLNHLEGPNTVPRKIRVASAEYHLIGVCKNNDCSDNNAVLLYSPAHRVVYGKLLIRRRGILIGAPPAAVAAELDRLWAAEWRQRR